MPSGSTYRVMMVSHILPLATIWPRNTVRVTLSTVSEAPSASTRSLSYDNGEHSHDRVMLEQTPKPEHSSQELDGAKMP